MTVPIPDYTFLTELTDDALRVDVMRELGTRDLYFFCRYILGYKDMETETDIHFRLCAELDRADQLSTLWRLGVLPDGDARGHIDRYLILIFRGAFKTSIMMGKVIQWLIRDPGAQIGVGSDLKDRAENVTRDIRDMIQNNQLLKSLYPEVFYAKPEGESDIWRADEFNIKRPPREESGAGFSRSSVNAFGLDPLPTGSHFSHVWFDDIENEINQGNPDLVEKILRNLRLFFAIPQPEAPIVMSGTLYSKEGPNTLYQKHWKTYKRAIIDHNGQPSMPGKYPLPAIRQKKADTADDWTWQGQFLLKSVQRTDKFVFPFQGKRLQRVNTVPDGQGGLWIFHTTGPVALEDTLVYLTVDPSGGADEKTATARSDKVGWWINAVDLQNRWNILDIGRKHLNDTELLDLLFRLDAQWHPEVIGVEKMPHLQTVLSLEFQRRGKTLPIVDLKPGGRSKEARIRGLLPMLPSIWFAEHLALEYQTRLQGWYTEQAHDDDDHDAGGYMIDLARPPTKEQLENKKRRLREGKRDSILAALPPREQAAWKYARALERRTGDPQAQEWEDEVRDFYA